MRHHQPPNFIESKRFTATLGLLADPVLALLLTLPLPARAKVYNWDYSVNLAIPDGSPVGVAQSVIISEIPCGDGTNNCTITCVRVKLNISGGYNGDLYGYLMLQSADGNTATSIEVGKTTLMQSGDRIQVFDPATGTVRGETIATNVSVINVTNYLLALAAPVPGMVAGANAASADCIYDLDASGEGYLITNNVMKSLRGHGARLRAGNGLMVSNRITEVSFPGILIGNTHGPTFYEGPLGSNIVIRGNTIQGVGYAAGVHDGAIKIKAVKNGELPADGHGLRRIVIEGNHFTNWPQTAITALSVTNLQVLNNQISSSAADNSYGGDIRALKFDQCTAIVVSGTTVSDPRANLRAGIHVLSTVATGAAGFSTNNLTFNLASGVTNILDERPAGLPPSITPIPAQTILAGSNLVLSISAAPLPLYFYLPAAPAGAAIDQLSGVFTWRPTVTQSDTTNSVVVEVQDHGSPNLSDTETFQIIVVRPAQPVMSSMAYDNGQFRVGVTGPAGLDYILQTTTNLSHPNWVGVATNLAAVPPLVLTNTPSPNVERQFYRVLLGP
jgi:hypothetical protein